MLNALHEPPRRATRWRWPRLLSWGGSVAVIGAAAWIVHRYLATLAWRDVAVAWSQLSVGQIAASIAGTALSFAMLGLFDVLAARTAVPGRVSDARAGFAGAVSLGISNTLGFHALTGSAVRYRVYASAGLGGGDVARIVGLAGLGVAMGFAVVTAGALCWEPSITHGWGRLPGIGMLMLLTALTAWLGPRPRTLALGRWTLMLPGARTAIAQMLLGAVEMLAAVSALYVLLPDGVAPAFVDFLPIYVGAVLVGIVSHAPGGLGVFETIMLAAVAPAARAALLCYRLTYSLLPFALASMALGVFELRQRRRGVACRNDL
jgi:uncharacterized membrane protein YbhN (UPF0104 family)